MLMVYGPTKSLYKSILSRCSFNNTFLRNSFGLSMLSFLEWNVDFDDVGNCGSKRDGGDNVVAVLLFNIDGIFVAGEYWLIDFSS